MQARRAGAASVNRVGIRGGSSRGVRAHRGFDTGQHEVGGRKNGRAGALLTNDNRTRSSATPNNNQVRSARIQTTPGFARPLGERVLAATALVPTFTSYDERQLYISRWY